MEKQNLNLDECNECHGEIIINSHERVCKECGLVINEVFQESSYIFDEKVVKSNLSKQYVAIGNRLDFVGGLGSFIGYENSKYLKDKTGRLLSADEQKLYRRLKKNYTKFLRIKNHETEYRIFNILNKISNFLQLNKNIQKNAAYYYRKIINNEKEIINNISLIAFCIFFAARKEYHNAPITIKEISESFQKFGHRVNPRLILRDGLKYSKTISDDHTPHKSEDYLIRLISNVINYKGLKRRMEKKGVNLSLAQFKISLMRKCAKVFDNLNSWKRGGRNPFILTGAVIYLSDKLLAKEFNYKPVLTQKIISEATGIAEYSIRDHYVNLLKPIFIK